MAGSLLVAMIAVLLLGSATLLWRSSMVSARQHASGRHLDRQLPGDATMINALAEAAAAPRSETTDNDRWKQILVRAGLTAGPRLYAALLLPPMVLGGLAALFLGVLPALIVLVLVGLVSCFVMSMKIASRRKAMVSQLPGLLDQVVRLVTLGSSMPSAFQDTMATAPAPLREPLERALAHARAGGALDQGLRSAASLYGLVDLTLLAAVVRISQRFGGRADLMLERMSGFMRDREQAQQELVAMSAETRLSAWVLGLLPTLMAGYIITFNAPLFMGMWNDPSGRKLLIAAAVLQLIGGWLLYRLARSL